MSKLFLHKLLAINLVFFHISFATDANAKVELVLDSHNRTQATCSVNVDPNSHLESSVMADFVFPTLMSMVPQLAGAAFTAWSVNNKQLGLDMYRGIRCFELGVRGINRLYDRAFSQKETESDFAVANSEDHALNRDMFGYLLADTIVQSSLSSMRADLMVHHVMGLALWGSALTLKLYPDIVAANTAVEILSAFKGLETTVKGKFFGDDMLLRNQRILKAAYGFRLAVILAVRYPIWLLLDWPIPSQDYEALGTAKWAVLRALNVGILGLETLWLYQTARAFNRLHFWPNR